MDALGCVFFPRKILSKPIKDKSPGDLYPERVSSAGKTLHGATRNMSEHTHPKSVLLFKDHILRWLKVSSREPAREAFTGCQNTKN